jgi:hypothetical protein
MILNTKAASLGTNLRTGMLAVAAGLWKAIAFRPETPGLFSGKNRWKFVRTQFELRAPD